jgi:hypothetical protein
LGCVSGEVQAVDLSPVRGKGLGKKASPTADVEEPHSPQITEHVTEILVSHPIHPQQEASGAFRIPPGITQVVIVTIVDGHLKKK